jgi:hypothetical protein
VTLRESWLKNEIRCIKGGCTIRQRCTMATEDRVKLGLCLGDIPPARAHRGSETCSPECQADRRRLRRWEQAKGSCRYCGHGLPRKRKSEVTHFPVTGKRQEWDGINDGITF